MSDPEPSVPASPPPSAQLSDSAALNYAFLVHSQKTLTQNLPPRVDNKLLARQKRRRTSPEDHAILEAEYQQNPKPDKAARANIVSRVSLGEKEVQIWFQNRRQNDRRRSKPLQPHELIAPRSALADSLNQNNSHDDIAVEPGSSSGTDQSDDQNYGTEHTTESLGIGASQPDIISGHKEGEVQPFTSSQESTESEALDNSQRSGRETVPDPEGSQGRMPEQSDEPHLYSAKRKRALSDIHGDVLNTEGLPVSAKPHDTKSPPSLRLSLLFDGEAMVRKEGELTPSPPKGRNALRIAMSSDGKAVIRGEDEPSPSKNRVSMFSARKPRFPALRRSSSAVVLGGSRHAMAEKDRLFGRSRDPRNWEAFFDTDARSALATPSSSQGTNVDSPGLFRSRNQRPLQRTLSARQNSLAGNPDLNTPVSQQTGEKRRKLSRTVSSLGRLETDRNKTTKSTAHLLKGSSGILNKKKGDDDFDDGGDSDKENWIPGTRTSRVRRRTIAHNAQRPVLKDANSRGGKANKNLGAMPGRRSRVPQGQQHKSGDRDLPDFSADVSAFMAGGGPGHEEDLDCIQGLLSLSQGAWR